MKEILIGSGLGIIVFLVIIGVNVTPLLFIVLLAGAFYFFMHMQNPVKFDDASSAARKGSQIRFDEIGGQDSAINELKEALQFVLKPEKISRMGIRPLKGVLLVGPPGTGKTLMARAAASFTSSAFLAASGSEFIEMYAGVGARRVRQIFNDARKKAKNQQSESAIIFIDELEVLGARRGSHDSHMEYDQTLNQLLVEMDGINQNDNPRILLIGATNRADMLDPALLRPGRFDRQVQVGLPDKDGREKILQIHARNKPIKDSIILKNVARETFGFSGAHLESLTNEAAILAMRENSEYIGEKHFSEAINKVMLGEKLDRKPSNSERERVSIHESGHALISEIINPGSVASLTIIPRGGALGFMRKSPQDDQYLYTRQELETQIMISLAGAMAEETKYGDRSTGARSDFKQAWDIAKEIVESGISALGIVYSEAIPGETLYEECKSIIANLEQKTLSILQENQDILYSIADALIAAETLNRNQMVELINA
ncbi:MAG: AAA family ATPase [Syntrophomonadaceae bacterium]|nr:AAA family ATPase [Syntrophomonadaceae bacterium]MDD3888312.1 AAA family ATPase [Syntrophomonadaceae bacterium]MDD4548819.1 AAA family ATPase [Syntrophomonadaceae bacterium]